MNADFISAIQELGKEKGIDPELLFQAVEEALVTAYKKDFGSNQNFRVYMNKVTVEIHVYAQRTVVEGEPEEGNDMSLAEAQAIDGRYEVGDIVETEVTPKDFGRIAAQNAKQVVVQRIREAERGQVYERFQSRAQDIGTGVVERVENRNVYIDLGKVEAVLTANEQIPGENYQAHDRMKTYIVVLNGNGENDQMFSEAVRERNRVLVENLTSVENLYCDAYMSGCFMSINEIHQGYFEVKQVKKKQIMKECEDVSENNCSIE